MDEIRGRRKNAQEINSQEWTCYSNATKFPTWTLASGGLTTTGSSESSARQASSSMLVEPSRRLRWLGPADVHTWKECDKLLCTALLGFRAVTLGPLLDSERMIVGYATRYGDLTWPLLYQCDVRCRLEHMERLRRVLERESVAALARSQSPAVPFNSACPWDSVWTAVTEDQKFWHRQFEEPALLILTRTGRLTDVVTGEAPIERSGPFSQTEQRSQPEPKRRRMERQREQTPRIHRETNGQFTHNRRGKPLCMDFQSGNCVSGSGISCPKNSNMTHQCAKYLGDRHGAHICNMTPREPSSRKGKGKGKNKY